MRDYHLYILVVIVSITFISILIGVKWRSRLLPMSGMIVSMYLGMSVGLTAGVTFGTLFQGNLFFSTILGICFGVVAGFFFGICFGLLSSIEGLMSGLMGGMMGAMLGEMIVHEQAIIIIKVFLFLLVGTIFLLIILSTSTKEIVKNKWWLLKPVLTAVLTGGVLYLGNTFNIEAVESQLISHNHEQDTNTTSEVQKIIQDIIIETNSMSYSPNEIVVKKNAPIKLSLKNSDQIEHDIEFKPATFNIIGDSTHQHEMEENVLHLHAKPKTTREITFSISETGTFEFYCTIPGHKENGMVGALVVK